MGPLLRVLCRGGSGCRLLKDDDDHGDIVQSVIPKRVLDELLRCLLGVYRVRTRFLVAFFCDLTQYEVHRQLIRDDIPKLKKLVNIMSLARAYRLTPSQAMIKNCSSSDSSVSVV